MEEKRNELDEFTFEVITSLNHLMQCNAVCKNDRAVIKINRFKKWVLELQEEIGGVSGEAQSNENNEENK